MKKLIILFFLTFSFCSNLYLNGAINQALAKIAIDRATKNLSTVIKEATNAITFLNNFDLTKADENAANDLVGYLTFANATNGTATDPNLMSKLWK